MKLSGLWVAAMFSWVYGDLLRNYSGDFIVIEEIGGELIFPGMLWLVSAITMIVPGAIVFLSLTLPSNANIIVAILFFIYNLNGLRLYPSAYDKFFLIVSLGANGLTVWYTWNWV